MLKMDAATTSKTTGAACWAVVILLLVAAPAPAQAPDAPVRARETGVPDLPDLPDTLLPGDPEDPYDPGPLTQVVDLPLVVAGRTIDALAMEFDRSRGLFPSTIARIDPHERFPLAADDDPFAFELVAGNPRHTIWGGFVDAGMITQKVYHLRGYVITSDGELRVGDSWLLGRNQEFYPQEEETYRAHHAERGGHFAFTSRLGVSITVDGRPALDCSGILDALPAFTFGKTTSDDLRIKVTHVASGAERLAGVTVRPHPDVRAVAQECNQLDDPFDRWVCFHSRALLPQNGALTTSASQRAALPSGLFRPKGEYELALSIEFDSWEDTRKYFNIEPQPEEGLAREVRDGRLILHQRVNTNTMINTPEGQRCRYIQGGTQSTFLWDIKDGYLEIGIHRFPDRHANGGNILLWSRYGPGHSSMATIAPRRIFAGLETISRSRLAEVGLAEIDLFERWSGNQRYPQFVAHSYPIHYDSAIRAGFGYHTKALGNNGFLRAFNWAKPHSTHKFSVDANGNKGWSGRFGIELVPGHLPRLFKNGNNFALHSEVSEWPAGAVAFGKAPMALILAGLQGAYSFTCTDRDDEAIELDYIRLYRPRGGY